MWWSERADIERLNERPRKHEPLKDTQQLTDLVSFARRLKLSPDDKQEALLPSTAKRVLLNCARQWGNSTVTAAKVLHEALRVPGSLIVVVSPSARQSADFPLIHLTPATPSATLKYCKYCREIVCL